MKLKLLVALLLMVIVLNEASALRNKRPYRYDVDDNEQLLDCYTDQDATIQINIQNLTYSCVNGAITYYRLNPYQTEPINCKTFETSLIYCDREYLISKGYLECKFHSTLISAGAADVYNCYDTLDNANDGKYIIQDKTELEGHIVEDESDLKTYTVKGQGYFRRYAFQRTTTNSPRRRKSLSILARIHMFLLWIIGKSHILD